MSKNKFEFVNRWLLWYRRTGVELLLNHKLHTKLTFSFYERVELDEIFFQ
jgi:hypothetical protein